MACPRTQEVPQPPGTQDDSQWKADGQGSTEGRRRQRRVPPFTASMAAVPDARSRLALTARSVADARRYVDAMLDFELYSTHLHEPMRATVHDATAESHR